MHTVTKPFSFSKVTFLLILIFQVFFFDVNLKAQVQPLKIDTTKTQIPTPTLPATIPSSGVNQTPSNTQIQRQTATDTYKVFQRPPTTIFGSELFSTGSLSFQPNLRIATPVNYVLGPDDEIIINVSGYQETTVKATVLPEGTIFIPQVGKINVNGLSIESATAAIRSAMIRTAYPSIGSGTSRLSITLSNIKSIHITIIGGYKPGNYTVSSLTTVFNALFLCGGPGEINTYRNIELIRGGRITQKVDIYQLLTRGIEQGNILLKEGDVINIPVYEKQVTISGEVKKPGIFELKTGEKLSDLLFYAGGFTKQAYRARVKVKQITDVERRVLDIDKAEMGTYIPLNGDEFVIDAVLNRYVNAVSITGAVYRPGEFQITPGLTLTTLIQRAGGVTENVFTDRALINRSYVDGRKEVIAFNVIKLLNGSVADIPLVKGDSVIISTATQFKSNYKVEVKGEVRKPGQFDYRTGITLKDILFLANGFNDAASSYHLEISRRLISERQNKSADSIATVFDLNTQKGLEENYEKFLLQPYDVVTVRHNPGYVLRQQVTLVGEVNYPGAYTIESKKEKISDLLRRAGGLTALAYQKGVFLIRNNKDSVKVLQLATIKKIQKNIKDSSSNVIEDITRNNDRIAINMQKVLNEPGSPEDYILQDGDEIQVLKADPLIRISGEVLSSTQTSFIEGKPLNYYLTQAGGTTERARRRKIYVLYANGKTGRTHNGFFGAFRSYPKIETGAEIIVPRKTDHVGLSTTETVGLTSALVSVISLIIVTISSLKR